MTSGHWRSGRFKGEGAWYGGGCLTRRQLVYWKTTDLASSHHYGSWQVTAALLHLSI